MRQVVYDINIVKDYDGIGCDKLWVAAFSYDLNYMFNLVEKWNTTYTNDKRKWEVRENK